MTAREIEVVKWLLARCDRDERQFIAGMAMAAALEAYPPEVRERALDAAMTQFRERVNAIAEREPSRTARPPGRSA